MNKSASAKYEERECILNLSTFKGTAAEDVAKAAWQHRWNQFKMAANEPQIATNHWK